MSDSPLARFPWTGAVLLTALPLLCLLSLALWQTPVPVSEAVAIFEDVANQPPTRFLTPDTSYYRPLFHITMSTIWNGAGTLDLKLALIKLLQIVPFLVLVVMLVAHLRPRSALDAVAAAVAVAVLVGNPGLRDNLEIPLSYTIAGMPLALAAWIVVNREPAWWHLPGLILLALAATGFKEQGLVLMPLVIVAWWTRAPGASRAAAVSLGLLAVGYVVLRLAWRGSWPMFEQAIGLGFGEIEPTEAVARFGSFPYLIYAYSSVSTIANVLFAEPTRGTFSIIRAIVGGQAETWQWIHLGSSAFMTALIGWWGIRALRRVRAEGWTVEARAFLVLLVSLLACGALSFNYSRDRLGGMAVPFYALAAYYAFRLAAARVSASGRLHMASAVAGLLLLSAGWQIRAVETLERVRLTAYRNQVEWLSALPARRAEFAHRTTYMRIMESMVAQGVTRTPPRPTRYPERLADVLGVPPR